MATPLGVSLLVSWPGSPDWTTAFRIVGIAHLVLGALAWVTPLSAVQAPPPSAEPGDGSRPRVLTATLAFLCLAAFAYLGIESAITGLAIPYAEDALGLPADRGRGAISLFWLGLLAGRLVFAIRAGEIDDARFATASGGVAAIAISVGVVLAWGQVELLFSGLGFALGGVFPLLVALAGRRTPQATATGVAVVAGIGSAGGFVVPWVTGIVGDAAGIAIAMGTLGLWCALIAIAAILAETSRRDLRS
jgi:fucose permease